MELGYRVIKGLKAGTLLRLSAQIFTWINTLILIRLLTPDDYGFMAMTMAFIGIFALMGDFGIGKAIIQAESLSHGLLRQAFTVNLMSCLLLFILFYSLSNLVAIFFSEPRVSPLIKVVACQHLIMIFQTLPSALASRKMRFKAREKVQFYTTLITSILTLVMAVAGLGVWSLIYGHLLMRLLSTIGYNLIAPCWVWPTFQFKGFSKIAEFSGLATVNDMLRYLFNVFGGVSVGHLLNKTELGVFSVARHLSSLPSDKIGELLNHLSLSSFSRLQHEKSVAGHYLIKSIQLASLTLFPVYFGLCAVAPELIPAILSDKWQSSIVPFQILCLSSPFRVLSEILATSITAIGEPKKNTETLLWTILVLPLFFPGIQYGIEGACWAWLIINLFSFAMHIKNMLPSFHIATIRFIKSLLPGLTASMVMLATLLLIRVPLSAWIPSGILLVVMIISGSMIFTGIMFIFFRQYFFQTLNYLRN